MGLATKCLSCYGSGKSWQDGPCRRCGGSGAVAPYRVSINLTDGEALGWNVMESSPKYRDDGCCSSCNQKLTGRKTSFCSKDCERGYMWRVWKGARWQKRAVAHRDGSACRCCGEVHESPIRPGGKPYPNYSELEMDHIIPLHRGGSEKPENCQMLCEKCHASKTRREAVSRGRDRATTKGGK